VYGVDLCVCTYEFVLMCTGMCGYVGCKWVWMCVDVCGCVCVWMCVVCGFV